MPGGQINWVKETLKHATLAAHVLHGAGREDAGRRWLRDGGVAVTTFTTLARLPTTVREADVAMLIVDEAHYVKNPDAARSRAVAAAVGRAQRALFLTATPMENRVEEFRTLVNYLQPQVARNVDPADAVAGANVFRRAVAPVYLRRNQADVLTELPEKIETEAWVQLGDGEEAAYRDAVQRRNLQAMRQAGFGPGSAKLERLREIVEEAAQDGMKVLVFSYFLAALATCAREFSVVGTITGTVQPAARQELVGEFAARPGHAVLLSQIEAGGVGMNMQAASVVVLIEPQWNPSIEDQAIARATGWGRSGRCRCTVCWPRTASTNGSVRSRRTSGSCSTTSPAAARRRRQIRGQWIPRRTGRRRSTTTPFRWNAVYFWLNSTDWG